MKHIVRNIVKNAIGRIIASGIVVCAVSLTACGQDNTTRETGEMHTTAAIAQEQSGMAEVFSTNNSEVTQVDNTVYSSDYDPYADTDITPVGPFISPQEGREYGTVETLDYYSTTSKKNKKASIVLPTGYTPEKQYPVLYLLHGMGGNYRSWLDMGADYVVWNAHYDVDAAEMIVVIPSVFTSEQYNSEENLNFMQISHAYDQFIDELENILMPMVQSKYSIKQGKENTAIAGYSLGGRESSYIAFKYPGQFGYIGGFSATNGIFKKETWANVLLDNYDFSKVKNNYRFIMYQVGVDDPYISGVTEFHDVLDANGIQNMYYEMEGGHDGGVWQHGLYNFVKRIFR